MVECKDFDVVINEKHVRLQVEVGTSLDIVKEALFKLTCYMGKLEEEAIRKLAEEELAASDNLQEEEVTV